MTNKLDRTIARVLFVDPPAATPNADDQGSENLMGFSLAVSAFRCTLQYIVLPFLLPVIGMAAGWALGLTMVVNIAAVVALIMSLRRMWATNYAHKWRYFAIAMPALLVLLAFFVLDVVTLLG
jgi:ABC-type iron transport system FetAB permease component